MKTARWPRFVTVSERLYRLLLLAYPPGFRRLYGPPMAQVFGDCCRAAYRRHGTAGLAGLWVHILLDLVATAPAEHALEAEASGTTCFLERGMTVRQPGTIGRLQTLCAFGARSATAMMLTAALVWSAFMLVLTAALRGTDRADIVMDFVEGSTPLYVILLLTLIPARLTRRTVLSGIAIVWGMAAVSLAAAVAVQGAVQPDLRRDIAIGGLVATVTLLLLAGYTGWMRRARR